MNAGRARRLLSPGVIAAVGVVLLLIAGVMQVRAGRGSDARAAATSPSTSTLAARPTVDPPAAAAPRPSTSSSATSSASRGPGEDQGPGPAQMRSAVKAGAGARGPAQRVMQLLAQAQTMGRDRWWAATEPLLSEQGRLEMRSIDPERVPVRKVTGRASVVVRDEDLAAGSDGHAGDAVQVMVPSDVGDWVVLVVRDPGSGKWLVSSLVAPEGVH